MQLMTFCLLVMIAQKIGAIPEKAVPAVVVCACIVDLLEFCMRKSKEDV